MSYVEDCLAVFARYFQRIDTSISLRLLRDVPCYEVTLTDELLACLDDKSRGREAPDEVRRLRDDLAGVRQAHGKPSETKDFPGAVFNLRVFDHGRGFEGKVSNVDVGLIIEIGEKGRVGYIREIYLLQAKRLACRKDGNNKVFYDNNSKFSAFNTEQHAAMLHYEKKFNLDVYRYVYYMPTRDRIDNLSLIDATHKSIFDKFEMGGIWVGRVTDTMKTDPASIYRAHRGDSAPFMAILLGHIARSMGDMALATRLSGGAPTGATDSLGNQAMDELALTLATGDPERLAGVQELLGIDGVAYSPVPNTVLHLKLPAAPVPRPATTPHVSRSRGYKTVAQRPPHAGSAGS